MGECRELQKMKNSGNELNEVPENKAHHFFEWCELCAFCAQISTDYALNGAKAARFAQTNQSSRGVSRARKGTHCRLQTPWVYPILAVGNQPHN